MSDSALATFEDAAHDAAEHAANPKQRKCLSVMDRAYILKARQQTPPATIDAIAAVIGCHRATVMRCLAAAQVDVPAVLATYADEAVAHMLEASAVAASKGYQQGALAILHYGQKLEPLAEAKGNTGVAVQVNVALSPGTPGFASPPTLALDSGPPTTLTYSSPGTVLEASIAPSQPPSPLLDLRPSPATGESET